MPRSNYCLLTWAAVAVGVDVFTCLGGIRTRSSIAALPLRNGAIRTFGCRYKVGLKLYRTSLGQPLVEAWYLYVAIK